jgi:hypothetical protein
MLQLLLNCKAAIVFYFEPLQVLAGGIYRLLDFWLEKYDVTRLHFSSQFHSTVKHRTPDQPTPDHKTFGPRNAPGFLQKVTNNNVCYSNFEPKNSRRFGQNNGFKMVWGLKFQYICSF